MTWPTNIKTPWPQKMYENFGPKMCWRSIILDKKTLRPTNHKKSLRKSLETTMFFVRPILVLLSMHRSWMSLRCHPARSKLMHWMIVTSNIWSEHEQEFLGQEPELVLEITFTVLCCRNGNWFHFELFCTSSMLATYNMCWLDSWFVMTS